MSTRVQSRTQISGALTSTVAAVVLEATAIALVAGEAALPLAVVLHVVAAVATRQAAANWGVTCRSELDLLTLLALGVPLIGPLIAWIGAERNGREDAHAAFEASRPKDHGGPPLELTGRWSSDLRRQLDVQSDLDVLRGGDRVARSNLVRSLAARGTPRDHALLRRLLDDPEDELRIRAFRSLRDAANGFVEEVARLDARAEESGADADSAAAAHAHLEFALSGALDPALVRFELERALECARRVRGLELRREALLVELAVWGRLGRRADAERALAVLGEEVRGAREVLLAWAELAFRVRDRDALRTVAEHLAAAGDEVPEWLRVAAEPQSEKVSLAS